VIYSFNVLLNNSLFHDNLQIQTLITPNNP